jgi:8-oxo-dGTP diphosphatase
MSPTAGVSRDVSSDVLAAGAVVLRKDSVLLVHRPRYDDWSFPKGKLDRGELAPVAAVREVGEETGVRIRLGTPLGSQRYPNGDRMKTVFYWHGRVVGDHRVDRYLVNDEIDDVAWVPLRKATKRLSYTFDRNTLAEALSTEWRTRALIVVRHSKARARKTWRRDDRLRPLLAEGRRQAGMLTPLLAAYAPTRLVSSSSVRCVQTLAPYAAACGWPLQETDLLSEEDASVDAVLDIVDDLLHAGECAVLCTHRPVLPTVLDALGVATEKLAPGELVVAHHRKGKVAAFERY